MEKPTRLLALAGLLAAPAACGARAPTATAPTPLARIPLSSIASATHSAPAVVRLDAANEPGPGGSREPSQDDLHAPAEADLQAPAEDEPGEPILDDPASCEAPHSTDLDERAPAAAFAVSARGRARDPLDASTIRNVVRRHADGFMGCYQLGLGRDPKLQGRVTTRFDIEPDGKIAELSIAANELPDCSVIECIRDHFVTIEFPPPGNVVTVQYPLVFGHAD